MGKGIAPKQIGMVPYMLEEMATKQYVMESDGCFIFQSYATLVAIVLPNGDVMEDIHARNYSRSTTRSLNSFIEKYARRFDRVIKLDLSELEK